MYAVAVVGSRSSDLIERLVSDLSVRHSVATISNIPNAPAPGFEDAIGYTAEGTGVALGIGPEGWTAHGHERTVKESLDDLAPEYDYCFLDGFDDVLLPTIAIEGDDHTDYAGETISTVDDVDNADLDDLVRAIDATEPHKTLESLVAEVKRSPRADQAGAIATFTGCVRSKDGPNDAPTEQLEFETYEGVAEERMAAIENNLEDRDGVHEVCLHHRTGVIKDGEDIVFVVVLAGHREEAFRTVEDGINRLKADVPIFKKEITTDETFWVHERS
jgi:molybdopterin synthase catalytic subunit